MHQASACLNCGASLSTAANYCHHCGQNTHQHRLSLGHLAHELIHFFTHADKGIFYLIKMLAVRPGTVVREYIQGRRKKHFSPLNFFFITVGLFALVLVTFRPIESVSMSEAKKEVMQEADKTTRERKLAKLERMERANTFMAKYSNYMNMALTPVFALIFFLFFFRAGYNYTEHLIANLYIAGFGSLVFVFIIAPYLVLTRGTKLYFAGIAVFLLWQVFYRSVVYYRFLNKRGLGPALYIGFVSVLCVAGWSLFSAVLVSKFIATGFK